MLKFYRSKDKDCVQVSHHLMLAWKEELQLPHRDDDRMEVDWCIQSNCHIILLKIVNV